MKPALKDSIKRKTQKPQANPANTHIPGRKINYSRYQPLIICLLAFLIYSNSLFLGYALDDRLVITENKFTQAGLKGLKDIFTTDSFVGFFSKQKTLLEGGRYRPLSIATFAIEKSIFGKSPFISHLINVLMYMLTCLLIFAIFKMILVNGKNRLWYASLPFLIAIIYTVHPLHTEVVTNIKGRDELLSFLGALFALYFILKYVRTEKLPMLLYAFCSYTLAMLSKENAITFLAVIPLTLFFFTKAKPLHYFFSISVMLFSLIFFFFLRYNALGFVFSNHFVSTELLNNPFLEASASRKLATIILTWGIYLKLLFIPHPLTHDYYPKQIALVGFSDIRVIITILIVVFVTVYALYKLRKKDVVSYGIIFFIITFSISSNLLINLGTFMNERFMYVSSLGFALIAAYLLDKLSVKLNNKKPQSKLILFVFFAIMTVFSVKTFARNFAWKDDYTLFTTDVKTSVNSAKCNVSAGGQTLEKMDMVKDENVRQQMLGDAIRYLQKGVEIHPKYVQGWLLFGNACLKNKDYPNALECYKNALRISPGAPDALHNILFAAQDANKKKYYNESIRAYKILAEEYKNNNDVYLIEISDCLIKKGNADSSLKIINMLLGKPKPSYLVYSKAGEIWGRYLNNTKNALNYLLKAHELKPDDLSVNENLGIVYAMMSNYTASLFYFDQCLKKEPNNPRILQNVALTYTNMGQKEKAAEYTKKAQSQPPAPEN